LFTSPHTVTDLHSNSLTTTNLSQTIALVCPPHSNDHSLMPPPVTNPATEAAVQSSFVSSAVNGALSGSPTNLFAMLNTLQLLSYLPLSSIRMPQHLRNVLTTLNLQSFLVNPFDYWLGDIVGTQAPQFAASYGYNSCLFLRNAGVMVVVGVGMGLYWVVAKLVGKLPLGYVSFYLKEKSKENILLRYWLQVYLDVLLAALLQTAWPSFTNFPEAFNSCLGIATLGVALLTPPAVLWISLSSHYRTHSMWQLLFEEFNSSTIRRSLLYSVYLFRRLLYAATLVLAYQWPKLQAVTFAALSLTVTSTQNLSFLLLHRPHKDRLQLLSDLASELCMSVVCVTITAYTFTESVSSRVETVCVVSVFASLGLGNITAMLGSIRMLLKVIRKYRDLRNIKPKPKPSLGIGRRFKQIWSPHK